MRFHVIKIMEAFTIIDPVDFVIKGGAKSGWDVDSSLYKNMTTITLGLGLVGISSQKLYWKTGAFSDQLTFSKVLKEK